MDVLNSLYDIFEVEGIKTVFQLGNIIEGEARFNKNDLLAHGINGQTKYLIDNFPIRKDITTKFITGDDHEGWYIQREGIDIGKHIQLESESAGRKDLIFLGHMEHNIELAVKDGKSLMRLIHAGGGSAYAISYTDQKYAESLQGGEKPAIVLVGHFHKFNHGYPREIHMVQAGCTEDQSPFMRKKRIQAMVGGCIIEFMQDDKGIIHNFKCAWYPFYDRSFYTGKEWKYHWI